PGICGMLGSFRVRPLKVEALEAKDERHIKDLEAVQPLKLKGIASRSGCRRTFIAIAHAARRQLSR
ncbi:MAG: hypothetical protein AAFO79_09450, partial [Pseudomonadota bacterium]